MNKEIRNISLNNHYCVTENSIEISVLMFVNSIQHTR
jgi:hypothetical protein